MKKNAENSEPLFESQPTTKKLPCEYAGCTNQRPHYESMEDTRPARYVEVPLDFKGNVYCSYSCAMMDGVYSIKKGWRVLSNLNQNTDEKVKKAKTKTNP
jgi:hypothetical protein